MSDRYEQALRRIRDVIFPRPGQPTIIGRLYSDLVDQIGGIVCDALAAPAETKEDSITECARIYGVSNLRYVYGIWSEMTPEDRQSPEGMRRLKQAILTAQQYTIIEPCRLPDIEMTEEMKAKIQEWAGSLKISDCVPMPSHYTMTFSDGTETRVASMVENIHFLPSDSGGVMLCGEIFPWCKSSTAHRKLVTCPKCLEALERMKTALAEPMSPVVPQASSRCGPLDKVFRELGQEYLAKEEEPPAANVPATNPFAAGRFDDWRSE